jgi:hypothetical protein
MAVRTASECVLVSLLAVSACGGTSRGASDGLVATATADVGIVYAGGPAPEPSSTPLLVPGVVTLRGHGETLHVSVYGGRRTRQRLAPGDYKVSGKSGDVMCIDSKVHVANGAAVPITLTCSVK